MLDCKPIETSIEMNHKLRIYPDQLPTDKSRYQCLVGRLIYLSRTRIDIIYIVGVVSQFMHSPIKEHMEVVDRILKYLETSPSRGLLFAKRIELKVVDYTDANWAGDQTNQRSTSGYFIFVGVNLVTWQSKKQKGRGLI